MTKCTKAKHYFHIIYTPFHKKIFCNYLQLNEVAKHIFICYYELGSRIQVHNSWKYTGLMLSVLKYTLIQLNCQAICWNQLKIMYIKKETI